MRKTNYTFCCDLTTKGDKEYSVKFMKLRAACGLDAIRAAKMFSLDLGDYIQIERGILAFRDWKCTMEMMCILSNKPLTLMDTI